MAKREQRSRDKKRKSRTAPGWEIGWRIVATVALVALVLAVYWALQQSDHLTGRLLPRSAAVVGAPLLAECPVNVECRVQQQISLPSHTLFVAAVVALHAEEIVLDSRGEVDFARAQGGLVYRSAVVRERPVDTFCPTELRQQVNGWRDRRW